MSAIKTQIFLVFLRDESSTYGDEQIPFTDLEGRSQNEGFTYSNSWNQAKDTGMTI